jgi:hypothetical protein
MFAFPATAALMAVVDTAGVMAVTFMIMSAAAPVIAVMLMVIVIVFVMFVVFVF